MKKIRRSRLELLFQSGYYGVNYMDNYEEWLDLIEPTYDEYCNDNFDEEGNYTLLMYEEQYCKCLIDFYRKNKERNFKEMMEGMLKKEDKFFKPKYSYSRSYRYIKETAYFISMIKTNKLSFNQMMLLFKLSQPINHTDCDKIDFFKNQDYEYFSPKKYDHLTRHITKSALSAIFNSVTMAGFGIGLKIMDFAEKGFDKNYGYFILKAMFETNIRFSTEEIIEILKLAKKFEREAKRKNILRIGIENKKVDPKNDALIRKIYIIFDKDLWVRNFLVQNGAKPYSEVLK
jgi:hypothetical protein